MPFFPTDIENKSIVPFDENNESSSSNTHGYRLPLSLDRLLINNPPSTFFARLEGDDKDLLVIDKSLSYDCGSLVVVYEDNEFKLRRLSRNDESKIMLSNDEGLTVLMKPETLIWGRVVYYIKSV